MSGPPSSTSGPAAASGSPSDEQVEAVAAEERVRAAAAVELVSAGAAVEPVVARTAERDDAAERGGSGARRGDLVVAVAELDARLVMLRSSPSLQVAVGRPRTRRRRRRDHGAGIGDRDGVEVDVGDQHAVRLAGPRDVVDLVVFSWPVSGRTVTVAAEAVAGAHRSRASATRSGRGIATGGCGSADALLEQRRAVLAALAPHAHHEPPVPRADVGVLGVPGEREAAAAAHARRSEPGAVLVGLQLDGDLPLAELDHRPARR